MLPSDHARTLPQLLLPDVLSSGECYIRGIVQHLTFQGCFLGIRLPLRSAQADVSISDSFTSMAKQYMV